MGLANITNVAIKSAQLGIVAAGKQKQKVASLRGILDDNPNMRAMQEVHDLGAIIGVPEAERRLALF